MHDYEIKILSFLKEQKESSFEDLENRLEIGTDQILWALENLSLQSAVSVKKDSVAGVMLTDEGKEDLLQFPEEALVKKLHKSGGKWSVSEMNDQIGLSWCKRNEWVTIEKGMASLTNEGTAIAEGKKEYAARTLLNKLNKASGSEVKTLISINKNIVDSLLKRGLLEIKERGVIKSVSITKIGIDMISSAPKEEGISVLTREIIKNGEWEKAKFKPYNMNAIVEHVYPARLHPYREFLNVVRQKWLEMGFIETSGPIIESAFWNFDALFSPQDHPTREMQDTFFLSNPKLLTIEDIEVLNRVKKMHTTAWKEKWSEEIAKSAVLRTHTTSVSARYMNKLSTAIDASYPLKLFSIGSVFRNESIDYKHLAELHQYDGIIVGDNLTLANLIDTLKKFYTKLGLDNVKFRPSYFPFTEPSLEAFYYDKEHGDSIELAGGGIIRKEITKAMGINKTVIAWGGGVDRLMISNKIFGLDSITTLFKNNIGWLRSRGNLKV
ncbi:MAG: phenylalanine--tRNA ligase subunit alpha [Candidatus Micrarchaeales archaeon]